MSTVDQLRRPWRRLFALIGVAVLAACAARWPTGFRLDVAVLAVAGTLGLLPGAIAVVAAAAVSLALHHGDWHGLVPFLVGVTAAVGTALVLRRPRPADQLPSRTATRLLVLIVGAAVLGTVEHAVRYGEIGHVDLGHAALTGARLLCGALIATAIVWRPIRGNDAAPLFVAAAAATVTVAMVISTIALWQQQDESLLHTTANSAASGFLTALANETTVVSTKAATSATEPFTTDRFPSLMQTVVFGHDAMPAAQLVSITDAGSQVIASLSSLGGDFEASFLKWTELEDEQIGAALTNDTLTYLGLASLPRPTDDGSAAYLVYGVPLVAPPGTPDGEQRVLVVAMSIGVMMQTSIAPTPAATGEAIIRLFGLVADRSLLLYATDVAGGGTSATPPGTFVDAEPPNDERSAQALTPVTLNDTTFIFAALPGRDFGTPLGLRHLILWIESLAGVLLVALVLSSGDQRARREGDRKRREALLSAALEAAPGWTAIVDRDGLVVMSNGQAHGAEQGTHVSTSELWRDDDSIAAIDQLLADARAGRPSTMQYIWSDSADASRAIRIFDVQTRPLPDPTLVYLQCADVTEHRDRAMRTAQSERMEAIGVLAGGLAHDFNNLLFITLGYLQMLERQRLINEDPQARLYVARATEAVERGAVVAKSLLSFARSQPLTSVPVNLDLFIHELQPLIEQALGSAHRLEISAVGDDLDVVVDPGRLSSSLLNTVFNARDAMKGPGVLEIRVERRLVAPPDGVENPMIAIAVTDSGRGMPHEVMSRAFEPFFTTKQFGSGTGLGLSTVYSFAQQSGGWATIDSTEGVGTTVTLFIPPAVETAPDDTPTQPSRRPTRALVVDDEGALADLVAGWLEDLGMETRVATTPDQAQHVAEEFQPELLVSDANLGSTIDGLELARILVERDPSLMVVFMTGFSERIRALQAAGVATLAKPFARDDLISCLTTHLGDRISCPSRQEHHS